MDYNNIKAQLETIKRTWDVSSVPDNVKSQLRTQFDRLKTDIEEFTGAQSTAPPGQMRAQNDQPHR